MMYDENNNEINFVLVNEEELKEEELKKEELKKEEIKVESNIQSVYLGSIANNASHIEGYNNIESRVDEVRFDSKVNFEEGVGEKVNRNPTMHYEETARYIDAVATDYLKGTKEPLRKKKSSVKRFFQRAIAITVSAALFGVIAGGAFQLVNQNRNANSTEVSQDLTDARNLVAELEEKLNEQKESTNDTVFNSSLLPTNNGEVVDSTDVSSVVEDVMPAIVAINCTGEQIYNYFGRQYSQEVAGSGSGIIIGQTANEILIVTNNHVISGASKVEIVFSDGTSANATIKGTEPSSDLAVLTVNVNELSNDTIKNIKVATLGNSESLKMGHMAIAIGNALGYGQSVTVGYISALNREVTIDGVKLNLIQTDAAINPGNSGGALLNINGEVIGINSLKYADTDVEGIGYAIPISEAIPIINELMNREVIAASESGYLGIEPQTVTEEYVQSLNMPVGVYVSSVGKGTPAEKAGLKVYDIIVGIDGKKIATEEELRSTLASLKAGTEIELNVMSLQNGVYVEKTLTVTLGKRPAN